MEGEKWQKDEDGGREEDEIDTGRNFFFSFILSCGAEGWLKLIPAFRRTLIYDNGIVTLTGRGRARVFVSSLSCMRATQIFLQPERPVS